jgi:transporter family-2 protein
METFAIPFLLFVGSLLALQAAANVQLSGATGSPVSASTLQLAIGAGLLGLLALVVGTIGAFGLLADAEPWHLIGGVGSAIYITAGILLFPRLGAIVSVGLFIAGQMLASLLLDGFGWLGVAREPVDLAAAAGTVAVVVGAALIVRAQAGGGKPARGPASAGHSTTASPSVAASGTPLDQAWRSRLGWIVFGVAAGAALPIQGAINAQLRADVDAPITAGAFSFIVATAAMAIVLGGFLAVGRANLPEVAPLRKLPWWGWLGGFAGATYVTSVFLLIPEIGVAPTVALTVAGQQVASVFVDRYGLLRLPRRPISTWRLAGVGVLLAGVVLIQVA